MARVLVRALIFVGAAALGLLVASLLIDGVSVTFSGFVITAVIYAVVQSIVSPLLQKVAMAHARVFLGGIGLVSAFVALLVASLIGSSLTITGGAGPWVLAALVVWLVTAIATLLLPIALVRAGVESARSDEKK